MELNMKPIIMSTEDVRGILDGRKTMMRRVVKSQNIFSCEGIKYFDTVDQILRCSVCGGWVSTTDGQTAFEPPYTPGDVMWVRETWKVDASDNYNDSYAYKADGGIEKYPNNMLLWRSPVTMPREAARLFLRVKDVRVERVQDITADDAIKEGCTGIACDKCAGGYFRGCTDCMNSGWREPPQIEFNERWDARNAKRGYGWDSNPWVWVIEFERVEKERRRELEQT